MTCFLVEIPLSGRDGVDRAIRTLRTAQVRLSASERATRLLIAERITGDDRLVCVIEAPTADDVRDLVALAFLPAERVREVSAVDLSARQDPVGDLGSGIEP
ncbi:hypothetical protein GCM10009776_14080 [Microbacterium deminutum]|uniref:DUF4242 domain-containing protein n=1 Tax=Microbacterium deminutum TaxID=344164 RepID=A0ABP5BVN9_9MICO